MSKKPIGVHVEGGKIYTISGKNIIGVVMLDQSGKELERKLFKKKLNEQSFTVPEECVAVKFLARDYEVKDREMPTLKGNDLKKFLDRCDYNNHRVKERIENFKKSMEYKDKE